MRTTDSRFVSLVRIFLVSFLAVSSAVPNVAFSQQKEIAAIEVKGNRRIETELIMGNVSSRLGEPLSPDKVREDVKNIYKLGYFEDVRAEVEETPKGVVLVFVVAEKPVLVDVRIKGNKEKKTKDIQEVIEVKEGRILDLPKVNSSVEAIKRLYAKDGFVNTTVEAEIEPRAEGTVSLTFDIKEGRKAYIKAVQFIGNKALSSKKLREVLYSKPKWIFSFITRRGLYNEEEMERDSERVRATYLEHGYIDAKVSKPEITYDEEKKGFKVTIRIEEGSRYNVGSIDFSGDLIASKEDLTALLKLKPDEPFSSKLLTEDLTALTTFYGDKGYAYANVEPKFDKDAEAKKVDITFNIEKGREVYIRKIDIVGNTRTRDKVIRREIPIEEAQLFNTTKIQSIKPKVFRLGYFEENVEVLTQPVEGTEDRMDVVVKVAEKPTGFFSLAGGFSTVENFIFAGQIQESNLFGYGKTLSLSAQIGGLTRLFILNFQDPHFLDTNWTLEVLGFNTERQFRDFDRSSFGGSITLGRYIWRNLSGRATYRFERVKVNDVAGDAVLLITESTRTISSVGLGLVWDTRNNLLDPSAGNISRASVEFAGSPFGGNTDFTRYIISSRHFFPMPYKTVLSVAGLYGLINLRNVGNDLVVSERFFLGGPDTLRGFKFRRVGPRVPTDDGDFVIIGGTQELLFQADWIFPIAPSLGFKGVVFFDMGNVFNDSEDLSISPNDLRKDVGFGIRWVSPFGPLRLEVGIPIGERLPGEGRYQVQFTIGSVY
jgi:outer membrane protein insertion porin family